MMEGIQFELDGIIIQFDGKIAFAIVGLMIVVGLWCTVMYFLDRTHQKKNQSGVVKNEMGHE